MEQKTREEIAKKCEKNCGEKNAKKIAKKSGKKSRKIFEKNMNTCTLSRFFCYKKYIPSPLKKKLTLQLVTYM